MGDTTNSIRIQDDDTGLTASVVECSDDNTKNGVVICNADGSDIG